MFDCRVKALLSFTWILGIMLIEHISVLLGIIIVFLAFLKLCEKVSFSHIYSRILHVLPFVLLMLITLSISNGFPLQFESVYFAFLVCTRVILAVLILSAMLGNDGIEGFISSLAAMKLPPNFVSILFLTTRYVYLFKEDLDKQMRTLKSRMFTAKKTNFFVLESMGYVLGGMFIKAFDRSEHIYRAMQARSYSGAVAPVELGKIQAKDIVLFVFSCMVLSTAIFINYSIQGW